MRYEYEHEGKIVNIYQKHIVHYCCECDEDGISHFTNRRCDSCNGIGEWESTVDLDFDFEPKLLKELFLIDENEECYEIDKKDFHKYIDPTNKEEK